MLTAQLQPLCPMHAETLDTAVHTSCPNLDAARVERCTLIMLDAIATHLDGETGEYVAAALPDSAAEAVRCGAHRHAATAKYTEIDPFVDTLQHKLALPMAQTESLLYALAITLSAELDPDRLEALGSTLPPQLGHLFRL